MIKKVFNIKKKSLKIFSIYIFFYFYYFLLFMLAITKIINDNFSKTGLFIIN